jgi:hypothetical protein
MRRSIFVPAVQLGKAAFSCCDWQHWLLRRVRLAPHVGRATLFSISRICFSVAIMPSEILLMFLMFTNMIAGVLILPRLYNVGTAQLHTSIQNSEEELAEKPSDERI